MVKPIPDGYSSVTPYLTVEDAKAALKFYAEAFGAMEVFRLDGPAGMVMHAEVRIGNSMVMIGQESPDMGARGPKLIGGSPVTMLIYCNNADEMIALAVRAGAKVQRAVQNQFYGDRSGQVVDPFGHIWTIATHIEDVSPEEMNRRMAAIMGG